MFSDGKTWHTGVCKKDGSGKFNIKPLLECTTEPVKSAHGGGSDAEDEDGRPVKATIKRVYQPGGKEPFLKLLIKAVHFIYSHFNASNGSFMPYFIISMHVAIYFFTVKIPDRRMFPASLYPKVRARKIWGLK